MQSTIDHTASAKTSDFTSGDYSCAIEIDRISVVVPLYNEHDGVRALVDRLNAFQQTNGLDAELEYVFVDDGSSDGTAEELQQLVGSRPDCLVLSHQQNQGIASAIATGLLHSTGDCVVSIDSDGSYDLALLLPMLKQYANNVDIIVASPYHPRGRVENVSAWRIALSKCASQMYRLVMKQKLYCYTSCFRVYRRERCKSITTQDSRFVGVAEFLWQADLAGLKIVEYPAILRPRLIGKSKMKLVRAMLGHLLLMARIGRSRLLMSANVPQAVARPQSEIS